MVKKTTGFSISNLPFNYLGSPLWKGNQTFDMYGDLISKTTSKLQSWNHLMLTTGGRLELIKSTLSSIPFYCLQVLKPPKNVIIFFERLFNKFLWGSNDNRKRIHWGAWLKLCYPKDKGGLGCRSLSDIRKAATIKLWWRFRTTSNIWSDFMAVKY
ncbi:hypothetical protein OROMI_021021 [Orobanche minor]